MSREPRIPSIWEPMLALVLLIAALAALLVKNAGYLTRVFVLVLTVGLLGGCASAPGRFTGVEWESRSAEQMTAAAATDTAVYNEAAAAKPVEARPFSQWQALFDMISGLRVRIRIICVEWGAPRGPFAVTEEPAK